jgi:hypothetical protein
VDNPRGDRKSVHIVGRCLINRADCLEHSGFPAPAAEAAHEYSRIRFGACC